MINKPRELKGRSARPVRYKEARNTTLAGERRPIEVEGPFLPGPDLVRPSRERGQKSSVESRPSPEEHPTTGPLERAWSRPRIPLSGPGVGGSLTRGPGIAVH